ncbi:MAG: DUF444 family protein [bacterium]|nr:DUF444 family protein [bacterium]
MANHKIDQDHERFREIVKGAIKKDLKKYITHGEMIGRKGKDLVSIPVPQIDIPTFRYGNRETGGVGQGDGEEGTVIGSGQNEDDSGEAGEGLGEHIQEVDITIEELARILGDELELPRIEPKGSQRIETEKYRYIGIRRSGPESLKHFKRTYREAMRRLISSGDYDPENPVIIPIREDKRYKAPVPKLVQECNAVIFYLMDVSGSMSDDMKEIVRIEAFWIDTWLRSQYKGIISRYIIHDAAAKEVSEDAFYHTRESGGTKISTAYHLFDRIVTEEYDLSQWNVYGFHFSDGDNWGDDNAESIRLLTDQILPKVNLFCYGQVGNQFVSGQFIENLKIILAEQKADNLALSLINSKQDIYDSIRTFLGKGK